MEIIKNIDGSKCTISVKGRLDTTTAPQLEAELKSSLDNVNELVIFRSPMTSHNNIRKCQMLLER